MKNIIWLSLIVVIVAVMLVIAGCTGTDPDDNHNIDPPDTSSVDTTTPNPSGMGTFDSIARIPLSNMLAYGAVAKISSGNVLAFAGSYAVYLYSPSTPENPALLGSKTYSSRIKAIAAHDSFVYVGLENKQVKILNISNPATPVERGTYTLRIQPDHICYGDDKLFVAHGNSSSFGVAIDVSNPTAPDSAYQIPVQFMRGCFVNNILYCTNERGGGVYMLTITDTAASLSAQSNTGGYNLDISATPWGNIYIARGVAAGGNNGLFVTYDADLFGYATYQEDYVGWAARFVTYKDNFAYVIARSNSAGSANNYMIKVYYAHALDSVRTAFTQYLVGANCIITLGNYIYVGGQGSDGTSGILHIYRHTY